MSNAQQPEKRLSIRRAVSELPPRFRPVFPYINFNQVQSVAFDTMLNTNRPVVISAPTGSGKTGVFELAIIKVIMDAESRHFVGCALPKVVYLAPTKALCTERKFDWDKKFKQFNIECVELTSDTTGKLVNLRESTRPCIILATPEKWDSITRTWVSQRQFIQSIKLLLIDEIHLVNDGARGATLEAVISRMKIIRLLTWPSSPDNLRFVAVSATVFNVQDIADWFSIDKSVAVVHRVDASQRPVKLRTIVLGYTANSKANEFSFDNQLNHKLADVIKEHSDCKPTLVFCATRKSATTAATVLVKEGRFDLSYASDRRKIYLDMSERVKDKTLKETLRLGIAFHHAGLSLSDRRIIEEGFLDSNILVLCCTSTLAMGVNLPAHLVIIKNTSYYDEGKFKPYSESSLVQMIGRAGRPQFDTEATAVIMTKSFCRDEIEKMLTGNLVVDSQLHKFLTEHLISEIVLGTITNDALARKWIDSTFLHVRLKRCPENYGLKINCPPALREAAIANWCDKSIDLLLKHKLIERTRENKLIATETGRAMARHYLCLKTMVLLTTLNNQETELDLLTKICSCQEVVGDIQLRNEDKPCLTALVNPKDAENALKYPVNEKVQTKEKKALVLIQATFGNLSISENNLFQESIRILRNASRVANCLRDVAHIDDDISYSLLIAILSLAQSFAAGLWNDSIYVSKQLENIGPVLSHNLAKNGLTTFELLRRANPRNIEIFCHRCPPFGSNVQRTCFGLPIYELHLHFRCVPNQNDRVQILVEIVLVNGQDLRSNRSLPPEHKFNLIVGCAKDDRLLLRRRVSDYGLLMRPDLTLCLGAELDCFTMPAEGTEIEARLVSEGYVGIDVKTIVNYRQPEEIPIPY